MATAKKDAAEKPAAKAKKAPAAKAAAPVKEAKAAAPAKASVRTASTMTELFMLRSLPRLAPAAKAS